MKVRLGKYAFNLTATRAYLLVVFSLLLVPLVIEVYNRIPFYYQSSIKLEYQGQIYTFDSVVKCSPVVLINFGGPRSGAFFNENDGGAVYPRFLEQQLPDGRKLIVNNNKCSPAYLAYFRNKPEAIDMVLKSYPQVYLVKDVQPGAQIETYFGRISYNAPGSELKLISQTIRRASFFEQRRYAASIDQQNRQLLATEQLIRRSGCYQVFEYSADRISKLAGVNFSELPKDGLTHIVDINILRKIYPLIDVYMGDYHGSMSVMPIQNHLYDTAYPMSFSTEVINVRVDMPLRGLCTIYSNLYDKTPPYSRVPVRLNYADKFLQITHSDDDFYIFDSDRKKLLVGGRTYGSLD